MKKLILWCVLLFSAQLCLALAPYVQGSKLPGADLPTQLAQLERKLQAKALGEGRGFGGDIPEADLQNYRYMLGMERFDSPNSELNAHASFEHALKAVQDNLSKGVGVTSRVYEVVMPESQMAVFGVAMNDPGDGEGWWANKIGADHMAELPYELHIVGNKVYAPYARYRIAVAWPALGMGQFMGIINAPEIVRTTLTRVAGGPERSN